MNLQLIYVVGAHVGIREFCTRCRCVVRNHTTHLQVKLVWRLYGGCTEVGGCTELVYSINYEASVCACVRRTRGTAHVECRGPPWRVTGIPRSDAQEGKREQRAADRIARRKRREKIFWREQRRGREKNHLGGSKKKFWC